MQKRVIGIFCAVTLIFTTLIYRVYYIVASDYLSMASTGQGSYNLPIATTRGMIYDRNMRGLVNNTYEYVAAVLPSPAAASAVLPVIPEDERTAVVQRLSETMPFALKVPTNDIYAKGVDVFRIPDRYGGYPYAPHIIGYLGGDGITGVAGIEKSYDEQLKNAGGKVKCSYKVDAAGHVMQAAAMSVERENETPLSGVCLTLDRDIQKIAQEALIAGCDSGAAVVLDIDTGDILAMTSIPVFDQNDIAASLDSSDAPFISRAVSGYNIGSVFKLAVSAAALEKGVSQGREHICEGYVDVGGVIFRCNNNAVHGLCDMQKALQVSCNTYFITLAGELGSDYLLSFCWNMGFGEPDSLATGMTTQAGNLPDEAELANPAALANFGFGQGSSLATPLQMATFVAAAANGGKGVMPTLVSGFTDDGENIIDIREPFATNRLISTRTADIMKNLMVGVVKDGSGRTANPVTGGAGGKTSSAQTGKFVDGKEVVHAWFAGFYPAERPKYSIVVFVEGGISGEHVAAPIFKSIADGIAGLPV